jgi:tetratricopeptide (TPR) repeat protein
MSTDYTDTQLEMLSRRWAQDASPHLSLQLADVYRQRGQLAEALPVLEQGLEAHPGHMSVQVALGRYRLEAGNPEGAAAVLRQVVDKDAGHLVANKLLVRAYLAMRDRKSAADRLELYALLNENDPELATLRAMVEAAPPTESTSRGGAPPLPATFARPASGASAELAAVARPARRRLSGGRGEPFRELRVNPLTARALSEIFHLAGVAVLESSTAEPVAAASRPEEAAAQAEPGGADTQAVEAAQDQSLAADLEPEPAAVDAETAPPVAAPRPAPERADPGSGATATLGALYLAQGHLEDARRTFESVLERDPEDAQARAGLATVETRLGRVPEAPTADALEASRVKRATIDHLQDYLNRIRTAAARLSA